MTEEQITELFAWLREISLSLATIARPVRNICPLCEYPVYRDQDARIFDHSTSGVTRKPDRYGYSSYEFDTPVNLPAHVWIHTSCLDKVRL